MKKLVNHIQEKLVINKEFSSLYNVSKDHAIDDIVKKLAYKDDDDYETKYSYEILSKNKMDDYFIKRTSDFIGYSDNDKGCYDKIADLINFALIKFKYNCNYYIKSYEQHNFEHPFSSKGITKKLLTNLYKDKFKSQINNKMCLTSVDYYINDNILFIRYTRNSTFIEDGTDFIMIKS